MIPLRFASGKRYAVFGTARTGKAADAALRAAGAEVLLWDDNDAARAACGLPLTDLYAADWRDAAGLMLSPGVPLHFPTPHALAVKARDWGVPIIGDIELFAQARAGLPAHKVVGITGTNGKSTTTALIHHMLSSTGIPALLGGNIGAPILGETPLPAGGVYVLELSSFQIDLTQTLVCDVAVITNMSADHLDRHGTMELYAAAKERLFQMQDGHGHAVIGVDDSWCQAMAERAATPVSRVRAGDPDILSRQKDWPSLQGPHNAQNAGCALATGLALGLTREAIFASFATYPGLPHRMERVRTVGGVLYVNDSKATNPTSTAPALGAYPAIHWIVGGKAKTDELDACLPFLSHVRSVYTIGASAAMHAALLRGKVAQVHEVGSMDAAVAAASAAAQPGEVVLLSPATASFDQFRDFEHRGQVFRDLVQALPEV
jgi:UDP-N-acetylmuramoylalanine--D-glutamate ligase